MTRVYAETSLGGITSNIVRARSACPACMSPEMIALYEESVLGGVGNEGRYNAEGVARGDEEVDEGVAGEGVLVGHFIEQAEEGVGDCFEGPLGASIAIKKWLKIEPKIHEFSADEVETESEDDGIYRLQRRKSETLRVQYISTKDIRVMIGTWNVAGKTPYSDIEIDEWLSTKEPADMYILGFQEVVPLSAGNVLGVADDGTVLKWEAIIRRTLNKSTQLKETYRSYSVPPSPDRMPSPPDDALPDKIDIGGLDIGSNKPCMQDLFELINIGRKPFPAKRIYNIDAGNSLDWPEHPLEKPPRVVPSDKRLRRVLSSSGMIGSDESQEPSIFTFQDLPSQCGLKRTYCSMGNLQLIWPEQHEVSEELDPLSEVNYKLFDEEADSPTEMEKGRCKGCRERYGSVSISMSVFQTWLCFVCSHLASGQKDGDQQRRNSNVYDILQRTHFPPGIDGDHPQTILSHDRIFWFGDLNYRLNMVDAEIRDFVAKKQWGELTVKDQLREELQNGHAFNEWEEGLINFPPTYKYERNSDKYFGEQPLEGEKKRSPACLSMLEGFSKISIREDVKCDVLLENESL
ncbi:Type I inositol 1,4,5-trisphosphate 5-phosphatase 2 [Acorus calamus]|uniref:Type I inositol 1,4,5-trisphosphate 5-phosphatase 2 n=1 Tax=Acorus calamus TaxID=4465 RepID=A0AAV9DTM8_ACOCL|nr:Type I inositol 1,4,5-trisphosphate 5-phosphatase 2 [Acorus calamus]